MAKRQFTLQPAIQRPTVIPYRLEGKDAPAIQKHINGIVDSQYNGNSNLKVLGLRF